MEPVAVVKLNLNTNMNVHNAYQKHRTQKSLIVKLEFATHAFGITPRLFIYQADKLCHLGHVGGLYKFPSSGDLLLLHAFFMGCRH